jgi:non-ribosomal peptide synthetase component F
LPSTVAAEVHALGRKNGATPFMTLLAAFQSLLFYYTNQTDLVLGTDVAGRTDAQTEALIGFFVNLLVLRTDLSGDPSFQALLGRVREVALGAYAHQDAPFDKLVEEMRPERSRSHNALVQVLFVQQNTPRGAAFMPGIKIDAFTLDMPSKFDLAVFVSETADGMTSSWVYNLDLFAAKTIARMSDLYACALERATASPDMKLSALMRLLTEAEQRQRASDHQTFQQASLKKLRTTRRPVGELI